MLGLHACWRVNNSTNDDAGLHDHAPSSVIIMLGCSAVWLAYHLTMASQPNTTPPRLQLAGSQVPLNKETPEQQPQQPQQQVDVANTGVTVVHVHNTGPMTGLLDRLPSPALLSCAAPGSKRKYAHTLEWVQPEPGVSGSLPACPTLP